LGAAALELGHVVIHSNIRWKPVVVAIKEGGERQSIRSRGLGDATVDEYGGGEGDTCSQAKETLGELEGRIDMALCGKCYEEDVRMHGSGSPPVEDQLENLMLRDHDH
jgi:hypothetical protein